MRKLFLILSIQFLLLLSNHSYSQDRRDIGVQLGSTYYNGEFNENIPLYKPSLAFGIIFRYNYNRFYSIRLSGAYGQAKGAFSNKELLPNLTLTSFDKKFLNFEAMLEFNFVEFNPTTSHQKKILTPFANVGIGGAIVGNNFTPVFPFGVGLKYTPGKRHTFALEWRFHKTFTDNVDNYSTPNNNTSAFIHNNDWVSFVGLVYTYRLLNHGRTCPVYK